MEAFSLLKYWKAAAGSGGPPLLSLPSAPNSSSASATTTIVSAASDHSDHDSDDDNDDGPFFDLEFAVPAEEDDDEEVEDDGGEQADDGQLDQTKERQNEIDENDEDEEVVEDRELEPNVTFSPSDDLFFNGRILRIDGSEEEMMNSGNKSAQFPIPVSLAKSATKFRVFLLGLKRSKSESKQCPPQTNNNHQNKKFFTVKFKVEEVPIFSLLTRASSNSKVNSTTASTAAKTTESAAVKTVPNEEEKLPHQKSDSSASQTESSGDEKKNKKEVVQKYLKMVKIKVSKKGQTTEEKKREKVSLKQGLNLKVIAKKHLGKSKSAVVHSMVQNTTSSKKRDDSLLQQQDGIQSAILHCKRSFNSSNDFFDGVDASSVLLDTAEVAAAEEGNGGVAA